MIDAMKVYSKGPRWWVIAGEGLKWLQPIYPYMIPAWQNTRRLVDEAMVNRDEDKGPVLWHERMGPRRVHCPGRPNRLIEDEQ
jgi:hypothetical protein